VRVFNFILLFSFAVLVSTAQNRISVTAETDTSEYIIGDYIYYKILLEYDSNIEVSVPSVKDSVTLLDFIGEETPVKSESDNKIREVRQYVFSKYDSALVTIPPVTLSYRTKGENDIGYIATNGIDIAVKTMEVNPEADIQDVKSPLRIPLNMLFIILLLVGLIIIAAAGYFGYRYYRSKKEGVERKIQVIKIPPHEAALRSLVDLEERKLWQSGKVKEYHSEITGIIRKYFEERFDFIALEMPSTDVLKNLSAIGDAEDIVATTESFLSNADLVKFAKFKPMPSVNDAMMKQAREIVEKTKVSVLSQQESEHV
jgi:hypothetical protein